MSRHQGQNRAATKWIVWIALFACLAGPYWPNAPGLAFMALALFGLLHLAVLVYEQIAQAHFDANMTPQEYEHYCAALLRESRWAARVTRASGDQGVDIVAEKRGARIVVQCKKYRKPVGNRAVQEIVAAIAHEDAQRGVVVATNGYTRAAERLAASNRVLLLHHSQLHRIDRLLQQ
ncbi:restriction endonuclease [Methylocystis sp. IM3]|jgi:restriction system protein|uniref:restriction endonuclease n=1 Tax=Methylocystis sp. IM3 TaxID=3136722 RepID=UPI003119C027